MMLLLLPPLPLPTAMNSMRDSIDPSAYIKAAAIDGSPGRERAGRDLHAHSEHRRQRYDVEEKKREKKGRTAH